MSVALELSFRMFLNASVKDFSYFLGSVGAFGDHFWGQFGVIFGPWGALGRQRAPRSNSVPKQILWSNILGTLLETKIPKNPTRAVAGRIFSVFVGAPCSASFFLRYVVTFQSATNLKCTAFSWEGCSKSHFRLFPKKHVPELRFGVILAPFW